MAEAVTVLPTVVGTETDATKDAESAATSPPAAHQQSQSDFYPRITRRRRKRRRRKKSTSFDLEPVHCPQEFYCPITQDIMRDPVITLTGHSYERYAIEEWLAAHSTDPMTGLQLSSKVLVPNHALKKQIMSQISEAKARGVPLTRKSKSRSRSRSRKKASKKSKSAEYHFGDYSDDDFINSSDDNSEAELSSHPKKLVKKSKTKRRSSVKLKDKDKMKGSSKGKLKRESGSVHLDDEVLEEHCCQRTTESEFETESESKTADESVASGGGLRTLSRLSEEWLSRSGRASPFRSLSKAAASHWQELRSVAVACNVLGRHVKQLVAEPLSLSPHALAAFLYEWQRISLPAIHENWTQVLAHCLLCKDVLLALSALLDAMDFEEADDPFAAAVSDTDNDKGNEAGDEADSVGFVELIPTTTTTAPMTTMPTTTSTSTSDAISQETTDAIASTVHFALVTTEETDSVVTFTSTAVVDEISSEAISDAIAAAVAFEVGVGHELSRRSLIEKARKALSALVTNGDKKGEEKDDSPMDSAAAAAIARMEATTKGGDPLLLAEEKRLDTVMHGAINKVISCLVTVKTLLRSAEGQYLTFCQSIEHLVDKSGYSEDESSARAAAESFSDEALTVGVVFSAIIGGNAGGTTLASVGSAVGPIGTFTGAAVGFYVGAMAGATPAVLYAIYKDRKQRSTMSSERVWQLVTFGLQKWRQWCRTHQDQMQVLDHSLSDWISAIACTATAEGDAINSSFVRDRSTLRRWLSELDRATPSIQELCGATDVDTVDFEPAAIVER